MCRATSSGTCSAGNVRSSKALNDNLEYSIVESIDINANGLES
jgi:hypothetical protein